LPPLILSDKLFIRYHLKTAKKLLTAFGKNSAGDMPMCCVARTLTYISDTTGFDRGEYFAGPEQVRAYFTVEVMESLYPGWSQKTGLAQADLDEMAGAVIHHKWHCVF
jgi:hypothetical protein